MTPPHASLPEEFLRVVRHRGRVFTTTMARHHGVPDSRLKRAMLEGTCHRQAPGIYSLDAEPDASSRIWAGLLIAGPQATLGGGAAAFLRGVGPEPAVVDVWTGHRSLTDRGPWRFHRGRSPDVPQEGDARADAEFARLATTRGDAGPAALDRAQELLALAQRERFLAITETEVPPGRSFLEARFAVDVAQPHGLGEPSWTPADDGAGPVLEARLLGGDVRLVLDPGREVTPRWSDGWDTWGYSDGHHTEIRVTFRLDDITRRPCATARRFHEVLEVAGLPLPLARCPECAPAAGVPRLGLLGPRAGRR